MSTAPIAAAVILAAAFQPAERPLRANDLPFEQIMSLASMPSARISEMQCGGYGQWMAKQEPPPAGAPTRAEAERLATEVARRIALDTAIPAPSTRAFVDEYSREIGFRVARSEDGGKVIVAEKIGQCASLFAGFRSAGASNEIAGLTPAGLPAPVNTGLAACYARYSLAATKATGEEAERHAKQAERARSMALAGKDGDALARAEAALAAAVIDETRTAAIDGEESMMRLVICLPLLAEARPK